MAGKGSGGSTPFEGMSHEDMLAWLDQANSGTVSAAAAKLRAVADEVKKAADELKTRPQWVQWKGEGAQAFRDWSGDLANSALRLAEYGGDASRRLDEAAGAIAEAQAAIPRDHKAGQTQMAAAQANVDAADAKPKDAKAAAAGKDAAREIEEIKAYREGQRQEAARQMRKLEQSYQQSAERMEGLERPVFPPPPKAVMPPAGDRNDSLDVSRSGAGDGGVESGGGVAPSSRGVAPDSAGAVDSGAGSAGGAGGGTAAGGSGVSASRPETPVSTGIDSVGVLPESPTAPGPGPTPGAPPAGRPDGGGGLPPGLVPPNYGGGTQTPPTSTGGRAPVSGRPQGLPGQGRTGSTPIGRPPERSGIVGGRPVPPSSGRPSGGMPRGTVVGTEGTPGRSAARPSAPVARGVTGQGGMSGGRRVAGENGGIVGGRPQQTGAGGVGRPAPVGGSGPVRGSGSGSASQRGAAGARRGAGEIGGIVGGRPRQQTGEVSGRSFTPGGAGLVRGASGSGAQGGAPMGRGGAAVPSGTRPSGSRRDEDQGLRPDYLTEDEETWQQGTRRVAPPVID